jgi:hypothetical protein
MVKELEKDIAVHSLLSIPDGPGDVAPRQSQQERRVLTEGNKVNEGKAKFS